MAGCGEMVAQLPWPDRSVAGGMALVLALTVTAPAMKTISSGHWNQGAAGKLGFIRHELIGDMRFKQHKHGLISCHTTFIVFAAKQAVLRVHGCDGKIRHLSDTR